MPTSRNARCTRNLKRFAGQYDIKYDFKDLRIRGWKHDRYEIKFPTNWEIHLFEYNRVRNEHEWYTHSQPQTVPDLDVICNKFKDTFYPCEIDGSYVRIHDTICDDTGILLQILCVYNDKTHYPYPDDEEALRSTIASLERENKLMNDKMSYLNGMVTIYKAEQEMRESPPSNLVASVKKYRELARTQYIDKHKDEPTECPVCMDNISDEDIFISPCNHVLCSDCSKRCKNSCPMCRNTLAL